VISALRIILIDQKPSPITYFSTLAKIKKETLSNKSPTINILTHDQQELKVNVDTNNLPDKKDVNSLKENTTIFAIIKSDSKIKSSPTHSLLDFTIIP